MKTETKLNVGDHALFFYEDEIIKRQVHKINIRTTEFSTRIYYDFIIRTPTGMTQDNIICTRNENGCFQSINELTEFYKTKFGESEDKEIVCNNCGGDNRNHMYE